MKTGTGSNGVLNGGMEFRVWHREYQRRTGRSAGALSHPGEETRTNMADCASQRLPPDICWAHSVRGSSDVGC